jgi:hypothetical protein
MPVRWSVLSPEPVKIMPDPRKPFWWSPAIDFKVTANAERSS